MGLGPLLQSVNERAHAAARGAGALLPHELKRFLFRIRPAAVTWDLRDHGLVFVQIPKVATTSMRAALAAMVDGDSKVVPSEIDRRDEDVVARYQLNAYPAEIRRLDRLRFTFAFVRNPLDRLLSAYVNKVESPEDPSVDLFSRHGISVGDSFPDFVRAVARLNDDRCDIHLRSQHRFVCDRNGLVVSFIGRYETLERDWATLSARFGLPELPQRNVTEHAPYQSAYTPELARIAADRYRRDIEFFGYESDVARLA